MHPRKAQAACIYCAAFNADSGTRGVLPYSVDFGKLTNSRNPKAGALLEWSACFVAKKVSLI